MSPKSVDRIRDDGSDCKTFVHQYLNGQCDALAIALAAYADSPIRSMHPVHVKKSGERVVVQDFLHAYALVDGQPWDCRGKRTEAAVAAEFRPFLAILIREDDERMDVEFRDYDSARDFVESSGCNPGGAVEALNDAAIPLRLDPAIIRMTIPELDELAGELEDDGFSSEMCL